MRKFVLFVMACLLLAGMAYAQDTTAVWDSLIVGTAEVESSNVYVYQNIQIFALTDDSVAFYCLPIRWNAPYGGVSVGTGTLYFYPLTGWDEHFDTVVTSQNFVRQLGWRETRDDGTYNPPLFTNGQRLNTWNLRFIIAPNTPSQLVTIDTCRDPLNGPIHMGWDDGMTEYDPRFVAGSLRIRPVGVEEGNEAIPHEFALKQNYPNPFNPETNVEFALPKEQNVSLVVYNLLGQEVRTLVNTRLAAGWHQAHWDGRNEQGSDVPSGVYFYRLYTPEFSQTSKMILLR